MELSLQEKAEAMGKCLLWRKVIPNMLSLILNTTLYCIALNSPYRVGYHISLEFRGEDPGWSYMIRNHKHKWNIEIHNTG